MPPRLAEVAVRMVVMVVAVVMERLEGVWGLRGRAVGVLVVVKVMLAVWVAVSARVPGQFIGVVRDAPRAILVMLLLAVVTVVVMRAPVTLEAALLLQLLLDMRRRRVADQGLHRVLRGQAEGLWVYLLLVPAVRHPVQLL